MDNKKWSSVWFAFELTFTWFCLIYGDSISDVIKDFGYPVEIHTVKTKDSYILHMHRIPPRRPTKKIVFLMHGLISCGADWVINRPNKSLGIMLHNEGFDVWLGNARGTRVSLGHPNLTISQAKYWDFSFHEIAKYDVSAMIDFVLNRTNRSSIQYIGHSQGTTTLMILLALYPEYNKKIISAHLLAPPIYFKHQPPFYKRLSSYWEILKEIADTLEIYSVPMSNEYISKLVDVLCVKFKTEQTSQFCMEIYEIFSVIGPIPDQFDFTMMPTVFKNSPAGSSLKQIWHFVQMMHTERFAEFDDGKEKNMQMYNSEKPPLYNLSNVQVNLQIAYATKDFLVNYLDAEDFINIVKNHVFGVIKLNGWNHVDFLIGIDAHSRIYKKVIDALHQQL